MQAEAAPVDNMDTTQPESEGAPSEIVPPANEESSERMQEDTKIEESHEKEAEIEPKEQNTEVPKENKDISPCQFNCLLCTGKASIKEAPPSMKETVQTCMLLLALSSLQTDQDKISFDLNVITQFVRRHEHFGIATTALPSELSLKFRLAMLLTQPDQGTFGKVETPTLAHFFGYDPLTALAYLQLQGFRYNLSDLKTEPATTTTNDTNMTDATQPPQPSEESNNNIPASADGETDITPLLQKLLTQTAKLKEEEQQIKDRKPQTPVPATTTPTAQAKPVKAKPISAKRRTPTNKHAKKNSDSGLVVDLRGPEFTVHGESQTGGCEWGCELCKGDIRLLKATNEILWRDSVGYVLALLMTSDKSLKENRNTFFLNEMMNFVYTHRNPPLTSSDMHGRDLSCRMLSAMNNNPNVFGRIGELYQYEYYLKQPRKLAQSLFQFVEGYNWDRLPETVTIAGATTTEDEKHVSQIIMLTFRTAIFLIQLDDSIMHFGCALVNLNAEPETKKRKPEQLDSGEKKKKVKEESGSEGEHHTPKSAAKSKIPLKKRLSDWNDDTDNEETPGLALSNSVFNDTMNDADLIKAIQQQADLLVQSVSMFGKVATEIASTIKKVTQDNLTARQENMQLLQQLKPLPTAPTAANEKPADAETKEESGTDTEATGEPVPVQV